MKLLAALLCFCCCGLARADEMLAVCYNFGCATERLVSYSEERLNWIGEVLATANSAERERWLLAPVVGQLLGWAGEQSPISADRAGNYEDSGVEGGMDCIDHATTTTRLLRMLDQRGALRFHRVLEPARRGIIFEHYSAQIEEIRPPDMPVETEHVRRFAVDSWYVDNGRPAPVMPLELWKESSDPI